MDTKLKKSKLNPIIKGAILILTLVFAFLTGTNALDLARKTIYFNDAERIQDTPVFKENVENKILNLAWSCSIVNEFGQNLTFEEFCNNCVTAKNIKIENENDLKNALNYYDQILQIKKLEPANDGTSYDEDYGMFYDKYNNEYGTLESFNYAIEEEINSSFTNLSVMSTDDIEVEVTAPNQIETTTMLLNPPNTSSNNIEVKTYKTHAEWEYEYAELRRQIFSIVDDARSPETIRAELEHKLNDNLKIAYNNEDWALTEIRNKYQNIDFLVVNKENGYYFSNFTDDANISNFKNNFKDDALYYFYYDGNANIDCTTTNIDVSNNKLLNFLYKFFYTDTKFDYSEIPEILPNSEFYIKFNHPVVETDELFSLNKAFIKNNTLLESELKAKTTIFSILTVIGIIALAILSKPKYIDRKLKLSFNQRILFIFQLCIFIFFVVCAGAGIVATVCVDYFPDDSIVSGGIELLMNTNTMPELAGIFLAILVFFTINFINYIVVNKKAGTFKERFICYKVFKYFKKIIEKNKNLRKTVKQIEKQLLIIIGSWILIELLVFSLTVSLWINGLEPGGVFFAIIFVALIIVAFIFILKFLGQVKTLALAVENMKNGNLDISLDSTKFVFPLKDFARNLNECRDSIEKAVGEALKGERLKTELITNVSHDLKTPLTSIINYVSLLKLCNIEGEDENKYLDILDEKSTKLKRLIEDLTEASKASSGNIKMTLETVNLNELALQAVGENNDILENVGLEIIVSQKNDDLFVKADSQHTFRIFDNLFSNVKKYALSGTRVYVDVYKDGNYGVFSVKNISKDKLNISAEEITERFVRGDNSRTTEGSGLGLSIARSFAELQNGIFLIEIDGDLFKVTIKLPITSKPQIKQEKTAYPPNEFGTAKVYELD